jgi:hypothetical protein
LVLVGLLLVLISPVGLGTALSAQPVAAQAEATTLTVNVELILDASGSMAEAIPGTENQTRMEAAKAAMREVIDRIPAREGLNVGFRVYGHKGSNSEADKEVSCRATELLVPIDGVDKERLRAEVEASEPTGWTPLALALEQAAGDFKPGGESVTNAVIMVTDGEETCGGDPCAVAGQLHAADIALTTHVVGFALSDEQQEAVRCIAEEGGGELFTAGDAETLSDAVFSAFEQVEATPAPVEVAVEVGGFIAGNAFSLLDQGEAGELTVVAVGPYDGLELPIVIHNNTGEDVENVQVEAIVRAGGELVTSGGAQGIQPYMVEKGGFAIGYVYFSGADIPDDAEFEFNLDADPVGTNEFKSNRDLIVAEVNGGEDGVVGTLANPHDETIVKFLILALACFDESGRLLDYISETASNDELKPGETRAFAISNVEACPIFLVAGYGFTI